MKSRDTYSAQEAILDSINEGVFTVDSAWRITEFNRAAQRITGVKRKEAIGRRCAEVFHADICEKNCALRRTLESGEPLMNIRASIINHQGQRVPIRLSTAILKDADGKVIGGVETFQDLSRVEELLKELHSRYTFEDIVGRSPEMLRLFEVLPQIASSRSTVLIEGPSGTGKELFARAIHNLSPRRRKPFVAVNCAALPDTLLESELFGYKAGAFTDAKRDKPGRFALADGGTLFLDEIGDISPAMQVRLLRVLQDRAVEPLGATAPQPVDVRVVAATHRDITALVKDGLFREDLYYRIRVIRLGLPTLKERRADIPLLVDHLVTKFNRLQDRDIAGVAPEVMARLLEYDFPGNVRELENIIEQAFVLCRGDTIEPAHLPAELRPSPHEAEPASLRLKDRERAQIEAALRRRGGNRAAAAHDLGIDVSTLYRKIRALGITPPTQDGRGRRR